MRLKKKKVFINLLIIILVIVFGFIGWAKYGVYKPMEEATEVLNQSEQADYMVDVEYNDGIIEFTPNVNINSTGVVIYPGGKVEPEAYAPLAKKIAEAGYKTIIVPMPLNLAVLSPNKANKVIDKFDEKDRWVIAGHSLGGAMASGFAHKNPDKIKGLVLWAAYPSKSNDFSNSDIKAALLYGTEDGLVNLNKIEESKKLLPQDAEVICISGGNHSQFGFYGFQEGDKQATISRQEQIDIVIKETLKIIDSVENE